MGGGLITHLESKPLKPTPQWPRPSSTLLVARERSSVVAFSGRKERIVTLCYLRNVATPHNMPRKALIKPTLLVDSCLATLMRLKIESYVGGGAAASTESYEGGTADAETQCKQH